MDTRIYNASRALFEAGQEVLKTRERWKEEHDFVEDVLWPLELSASQASKWLPRSLQVLDSLHDQEELSEAGEKKRSANLELSRLGVLFLSSLQKSQSDLEASGYELDIDFENLARLRKEALKVLAREVWKEEGPRDLLRRANESAKAGRCFSAEEVRRELQD